VPAVGEPAREFHGLGTHPAGVDPRRRVRRRTAQPEPRQLEEVAVVLDGLAREHLPDDLDVLAGAPERAVVLHPVPPLDEDGPARSESEAKAPVRDLLEGRRGLAQQCGRTRVDVDDRRADPDVVGAFGHSGERRHRVTTPRLREPRAVVAQVLGQAGVVDERLDGRLGGDREKQVPFHVRSRPATIK